MTTQTTRCGECFNCLHVANAAQDYSTSPTDRRQYRELGAMFPCEASAEATAIRAYWSATLGRRVTIPE